MLFDIFNNFKKKFYNFNVFKITSINYLTKKYFGLFIKIVNTFITYYKNDKKNIPNEFNIELWNLLITYYNNNKIYDIKCFENLLNIKCLLTDEIFNDFKKYESEIIIWCNQNNINSKIFLVFIENYTKNIFDILTIKRNSDSKYSEPNIIDIMKNFSSSFIKTLDTDTIYEKIIKSFMFGYPYQFCFKMKNEIFHTGIEIIKLINFDTKINNAPYIFYIGFDKSQEYNFTKNNIPFNNKMLEMKITNKIKVEWLCSILPFYYNSNNFKTIYINYDDEEAIKILEHNGYYFENLIYKITNGTDKTKVLFDNVDKNEYPILYQYVKATKNLLKN
jgi:hypothetical protein